MIQTHEDNRRVLVDIPTEKGAYKILKAKEQCIVGNHYHALKTEVFTVIEGEVICEIIDTETEELKHLTLTPGSKPLIVQPFDAHRFIMQAGAILACIASHPHNPEDDYSYPF